MKIDHREDILPGTLDNQQTVNSRGAQCNVQGLEQVTTPSRSDFFQVRFALFDAETRFNKDTTSSRQHQLLFPKGEVTAYHACKSRYRVC